MGPSPPERKVTSICISDVAAPLLNEVTVTIGLNIFETLMTCSKYAQNFKVLS